MHWAYFILRHTASIHFSLALDDIILQLKTEHEACIGQKCKLRWNVNQNSIFMLLDVPRYLELWNTSSSSLPLSSLRSILAFSFSKAHCSSLDFFCSLAIVSLRISSSAAFSLTSVLKEKWANFTLGNGSNPVLILSVTCYLFHPAHWKHC